MQSESRSHFIMSALMASIVCMPLLPLGDSDAEDQIPTRSQSYFFFIRGVLESLNGNSQDAIRLFSQAQQIETKSHYITLRQVEEYLNLSETETASTLLHEIESTFVNDPEFFVLRARTKAQSGQYEAGLKDLDRSVSLYFAANNTSKAREIILTKVALQADQKDYRGSVQSLSRYLKRNPNDEIAHYFLGKVHALFSKKNLAKKSYKQALEIRPNFLAAAKALGLIYELDGLNTEAFDLYLDILRSGTADDDIVQKVINLSLIRENYSVALEAIAVALQWRADDLQNNLRAGLIHFKLGSFDNAETFFNTAAGLEGAPQDRIHFYLGSTLRALGRNEEAIQSLLKVEVGSDYFPEAQIQLATIYEKNLLLPQKAVQSLNEAIALKPILDLVLAKASLLEERDDLKGAIETLVENKKWFPKNERFLMVLGSLQERSGANDDSIETMRQILDFDENNIHALNHIGYSLTQRSIRLDEAESLLKKAAQLAPKNGFILDSLGWLYFKTGRYQKAYDLLSRANKLSPKQAVILEHLGDTLHRLNKVQAALETYRQIVRTEDATESASEDSESRLVRERVREKLLLLVDSSPVN